VNLKRRLESLETIQNAAVGPEIPLGLQVYYQAPGERTPRAAREPPITLTPEEE
jgi:hypothetical protein